MNATDRTDATTGKHNPAPTMTMEQIRALPALITVPTVRKVTGMHDRSIQYMAARGEIPGVRKVGNRFLFNTKALLEFVGLESE